MKKIIVAAALAAMSTVAFAQGVELYGLMRVYQERDSVGGAQGVNKQTSDLSRWGLRGTENLGGGLKGFFTIESSIAADAPGASVIGDRTSIVGLDMGSWKASLGRDIHQVGRILNAFDPLDNAFGSTAGTIHNRQGMRVENAAFVSMNPIKGVNAHYQYSSAEANGVKATQSYGVDAAFGPLTAAAARFDNGQQGVSKAASTLVAGRINVGTAGTSVIGMWSEDDAGLVRTQGKTVGIQQQLSGPLMIMATYGKKESVDAYAIGATYGLSKRTFLHARYRDENATVNTLDRKQFGMGVEHRF